MKVILNILGALFTLVGLVWILQGIDILPGSMMSGHIQYAILGLVVAAIGIALIVYSARRSRALRDGGDHTKLGR